MSISTTRLLVVDDDRDFAESLADLLQLSGYEVELAYSGDEAIRRCREQQFDLALMDVRMPGTDGIDSFLEIRRSIPDFRAILMTAHTSAGRLEHALSRGARATLRKPLPHDRLIELIETHRARQLILLIDDDIDFADSLESLLHSAGYAVAIAGDGASALREASRRHPDAILLDLRLDESRGVDVFAELQRRGLGAPTVVITAYLAQEIEAVGRLLGREIAGVLEKPILPEKLLSVLATIERQELPPPPP